MSYTAALDSLHARAGELHTLGPGPRRKFRLEEMRTLIEALGHPERRFPAVLIAGTNGKGSTSATLAAILQAAGYRTGLYTSPHLVRVNERIRIDGVPIADDDFARLYFRVDDTARRLIGEGKLPGDPSFFEILTALAFEAFAAAHIDIAVLEVGMGGRLDATNVVEPLVSVITDVSLDHMEWLGDTIDAIAREKAGILRPNGVLVTLPQHPRANQAIGEVAFELGVRGVNAAEYVPATVTNDGTGLRVQSSQAASEGAELRAQGSETAARPEGARLQPCHTPAKNKGALAPEGVRPAQETAAGLEGARLQPCHTLADKKGASAHEGVRPAQETAAGLEGARLQPCHTHADEKGASAPEGVWPAQETAGRLEGARLQPCHTLADKKGASAHEGVRPAQETAAGLEGARLQPCHTHADEKGASAPEGVWPAQETAGRLEGARLQPCHTHAEEKGALAPEGLRNRYQLTVLGKNILIDSPLAGEHQRRNLALAIAAAVELRNHHGYNIEAAHIEHGIRNTEWPGRLELFSLPNQTRILLDVAHNPAGAWSLRAAVSSFVDSAPCALHPVLLFGCMRDKAIGEMAQILFPLFDCVIITPVASPRSAGVDELMAAAARTGIDAHPAADPRAALDHALATAPPGSLIVIAGSVYLIGAIRPVLEARLAASVQL